MDPILLALASQAGIHFMGVTNAQMQAANVALRMAQDGGFACDAQPSMITVSNAGIPAFLSTFIDPKLIEVLVAPMKAAEIVGEEVKKGDWTTKTAMFAMVESTGQTSAYGDYSNNGSAGANVNFPERQSFHYQVITEWGEMELATAGLARIDLANRKNIAGALTLNKYQNKTYFFGVAGLALYGFLNSPNLIAAITPGIKALGGTQWSVAGVPNATALEVLADIQKLYYQLQSQAGGLIDLETPMTLAMSPLAQSAMTFTNEFKVNVADLLKKNYPNLSIRTAPEYSTASGEFVQLFVEELEGQKTAQCAFTEKMRAHPIKVELSSFQQKKSQGTFGTIIYRPFLIASLLGA